MKTGMQMLLESFLPPDTLSAIQKAATDIPAIAQRIGAQLNRMEESIERIEATVMRVENKVRGEDPPEETALSKLAVCGPTHSFRSILPSEGNGEFPATLKRMVETDG